MSLNSSKPKRKSWEWKDGRQTLKTFCLWISKRLPIQDLNIQIFKGFEYNSIVFYIKAVVFLHWADTGWRKSDFVCGLVER